MISRNSEAKGVVVLRLPPSLKDSLRVSANANRRSLNAEITVLLEKIMKTVEERNVDHT